MTRVRLVPSDEHFEYNVQQLHQGKLVDYIVIVVDGRGITCQDVRVMANGLFAYTPIRGEVHVEMSRVTNVTFYMEV